MNKPDEVEEALLEAIWVMRWNKEKTSMHSVLTPEEAQQMVADIFEELDKAGYEIKPKAV